MFAARHPSGPLEGASVDVSSVVPDEVGVCASQPERAAQALVDKGYTPRFDYALQVMIELSYGKWRKFDPEDTIRFYALHPHEAGMIKSTSEGHCPGYGLAFSQ